MKLLDKTLNHLKEIAYLESTKQLLGWDRQAHMPPAAASWRSEQSAYLARCIHKLKLDEQFFADLTELLDSEIPQQQKLEISRVHEQIKRVRRLPGDLIEAIARASARAEQAWRIAKPEANFSLVKQELKELFELKKEYGEVLADESDIYIALVRDYEPHITDEMLENLIGQTGERLKHLVARIPESSTAGDIDLPDIPPAIFASLSERIGTAFGFDWKAGTMALTAHPFCSGHGPGDVRISTFASGHSWIESLAAVVHELGHALYEQGAARNDYSLPQGKACSLAIHESQSFIWERHVGQTLNFWNFCAEELSALGLDGVDAKAIVKHFNTAKRSLIRIDADELTYGLHIIIRTQLEQKLISGDLIVQDLPDAWNDSYREFLSLTPGSDTEGVLQDMHWYEGIIGYFPTYLLGAINAAQLFSSFTEGEFSELEVAEYPKLCSWLEDKIYSHGQVYKAHELIRHATGKPFSDSDYFQYLERKYIS